ncbi:hypothetical protein [Falsiroseomonas sp.]|uniref:hypothetical protein n=1 Tax=Falsiroseomonas sp. TaxID=2870721 RepID=UPI0035658A6C
MQAWRERVHGLTQGALSVLAWMAVARGAVAQVAPPLLSPDAAALAERLALLEARGATGNARTFAMLLMIGVLVAFMVGSYFLIRHLATQAAATGQKPGEASSFSGRYFDLPLGAPEGSVRALVSIFIITFGFLLLALQNELGLTSGEAVAGFLGTVITFYFSSRNAEQSRQIVEGAREAVERATTAAQNAGTAASNASAAATDAGSAARSAAGTAVVVAGTAGTTPEQQARLATLRDAQTKLQALRGLIAVAGTLGVGTGAVAGADRALARVDGLLARIGPVVGGSASVESIGRLAEEAGSALRELGDLGPVGNAVSDAMATVGRVAAQSTPIANVLTGMLGGGAVAGPAGLVAAVVVGGLQLVKEKEKFDRWKAAMLDTPLDLGLLPTTVDAGLATAALRRAPLLSERLGTAEPAIALAVWEAVGTRAGQVPAPAREVAEAVLAGGGGEGGAALRAQFAGNPEVLADAIEDLRAAMTGVAALQGLDLQRITVAGAEVSTMALAGAVRAARQDSRVAAELERMVYLVEALGKADPATLEAVSARLGATDFLRGAEAEAAAKARAAEQASTTPEEGG